jgi:hypothetical protein
MVYVTRHPLAGRVRHRTLPDGTVEILDGWVEENLIVVDVPQLRGIPTYGGVFSGHVYFHKKAAKQLQAAWAEVKALGLMNRVLFWDGSYAPRMVRGSKRTLSNHALGLAFDINAEWNGLGVTPPPVGEKGSVRELVPIFEKHGFRWGGNWKKRLDGMHFEVREFRPEN